MELTRMWQRLLAGSLALSLLYGCAGLDADRTKGWDAQKLYSEAKSALDSGDYETAVKYYELLEARFPLGRLAQQAQLDTIYAYYKFDEPESALVAADRFIKLYPRHPQVDYVYYMKGLVHFDRGSGFLQKYLPLDMAERDQAEAKEAFRAFEELLKRFPDSRYAEDALQRMRFLRNALARYELNVADYYLRRQAYLAAARRAQYVVEHYDRTPSIPGALVTMVQAYRKMGMNDLADDALRVLEVNYPEHPQLPELRVKQNEG
jgi:outer membrane protein assembly factor BamD